MKKILFIMSLSYIGTFAADLSVNQIQNMINKIHEKREGVELDTLDQTKEPFIKIEEHNNTKTLVIPGKNDSAKLTLHAIMNQKAYINDQWTKVGDTILGYEVKYIGKSGVVLKNGNQIRKLFLHKKKSNFILTEERD